MEIVKIFKDYGGLGILTVWLLMTSSRVDKLEQDLSNCNDEKVEIMKPFVKPQVSNYEKNRVPLIAILTQPITIKNVEDER